MNDDSAVGDAVDEGSGQVSAGQVSADQVSAEQRSAEQRSAGRASGAQGAIEQGLGAQGTDEQGTYEQGEPEPGGSAQGHVESVESERFESEHFESVRLDDAFARTLPELGVAWHAAPTPDPVVLALNTDLAEEMGLDPESLQTVPGARFLAGTLLAEGSRPVAQLYSGHQFGTYSSRLGDGRALLLGEMTDRAGRVRDLHLKGSGPTPFARADGFAAVGPMLREYVFGEAMHALGIPTTRALAVVGTGRRVARDDLLPGAVLARVAASHLRVGSLQFARSTGDVGLLRRVVAFALDRHAPEHVESAEPARALLRTVVASQADLVARWMLVGFVHGVMNTDNVTLSGETIDYGPCAFLDTYDPAAVFSSIDRGGRYAYGRQPDVALWNLTRLAESLLPLLAADPEMAKEIALLELDAFTPAYDAAWVRGMRAKLGLPPGGDGGDGGDGGASGSSGGGAVDASTADTDISCGGTAGDFTVVGGATGGGTAGGETVGVPAVGGESTGDGNIHDGAVRGSAAGDATIDASAVGRDCSHADSVDDQTVQQIAAGLLADLQMHRADYTSSFRRLAHAVREARGDRAAAATAVRRVLTPAGTDQEGRSWSGSAVSRPMEWIDRWLSCDPDPDLMDRTNPAVIPRNRIVDAALAAAEAGDLAPVHELVAAVRAPFDERPAGDPLVTPPPPDARPHRTYCGT